MFDIINNRTPDSAHVSIDFRIVDQHPWMQDGLCTEVDADMFFSGPGIKASNDAKRVCGLCPVKEQCLEYALSFSPRELVGTWAGTTSTDRREIRRERSMEGGYSDRSLSDELDRIALSLRVVHPEYDAA